MRGLPTFERLATLRQKNLICTEPTALYYTIYAFPRIKIRRYNMYRAYGSARKNDAWNMIGEK